VSCCVADSQRPQPRLREHLLQLVDWPTFRPIVAKAERHFDRLQGEREMASEQEKPTWKYALVAFVFFVTAALICLVSYLFHADFGLPTLALGGVLVLLAALLCFSTLMNVVGLSDKTQALGLPEGSVRAIIALALVGLFAILASSFLVTDQAVRPTDDFSKQMMTLVGTLMTAVVSFYFGATPKASGDTAPPPPGLSGIENGTRPAVATAQGLTLTGSNLNNVRAVRLASATGEVDGTNILSNQSQITCTLPSHPALAVPGTWDVTVVDDMGRSATKKNWLTITEPEVKAVP